MLKEIDRLVDTLHGTDPYDPRYEYVLTHLERLMALNCKVLTLDPAKTEASETKIEPPTKDSDKPKRTRKTKDVADPTTAEVAPSEPSDLPDAATVREVLSAASTAGVVIRDIVSAFVPDGKEPKFSNIPAAKYPELLAREELKPYAV